MSISRPPKRNVDRRDPESQIFFGGRLLDAPRAAKLPAPGRAKPLGKASASEAVWVRGGRIEAVGSLATLRRRAGRGVALVDLDGGTLTPGFADAHIHLVTWRRGLDQPWMEEQSPEAIERAVAARLRSAPDNPWILVRGWVPRAWSPERRTRGLLDAMAPDRPLVLHAVDGHSVWANGAALRAASLDEDAPDPEGGRIERDASGRRTGILIEEARLPLLTAVAHGEAPEITLKRAIERVRGLGVTSAHDFDRSTTWRAAQALERTSGLGFRLLLSVPLVSLPSARALGLGSLLGGETLRIGPVKMFADGTLGSATALLEAPYEGKSDRGIEVASPGVLTEGCLEAARGGLGVAIHAIGDRAVRHALDAIEAPLREGFVYPLPPRVEHVQLARREDFARFRALGAVASVQPVHQVTDRDVARNHWGARTERAYAYKSLAQAGAPLLFGSDAPFDRPGPLLAIQAALMRRRPGEAPSDRDHPEQRLRLAQALRAHLEEPHRAAGWRTPLGRIAPGFGADLVRFDHDLAATPVESWHQVAVTGVWVDGRAEVFEKS